MKLLTDGTEKSPLLGFCLRVVSEHAANWPPTEEVLAQEFVAWLGFGPFLTREAVLELCRAKGVNVSFAPLPQDIRGFNCSFKQEKLIVISEPAYLSDSHTLFHEFREMLEHVFTELDHPTTGAEGLSEVQAEQFAVICRMTAAESELPDLIASAQKVENRWARYLACTALGVFTLAYLIGCVLTPTMEEIPSKSRGNVTYVCNACMKTRPLRAGCRVNERKGDFATAIRQKPTPPCREPGREEWAGPAHSPERCCYSSFLLSGP